MKFWHFAPVALAGCLAVGTAASAQTATVAALAGVDDDLGFRCYYSYSSDTGGFNNCAVNTPNGVTLSGTTGLSKTSAVGNARSSSIYYDIVTSATADLSSGTLTTANTQGNDSDGRGAALAYIKDVLHFTVAGANSSTITPIQFEYHVSGAGYPEPHEQGYGVSFFLSFADANNPYYLQSGVDGVLKQVGGAQTFNYDTTHATVVSATHGLDVLLDFNLIGASEDVNFYSELACDANAQASCSAESDTGAGGMLGFIAKHGVAFTADSLTLGGPGNVAPVPETGTWAMLVIGFGVTGGAVRRRKSRDRLAHR